jgi:hypothetical protein
MMRLLTPFRRFLSCCVFLLLDGPVDDADARCNFALQRDCSHRSGAAVFGARRLWPAVFVARRPGLYLERRRSGLLWRKLRHD